jgi:hypothetical protein
MCIVMWQLISHHQTFPFNKSLSHFISALIHTHIQTQNTLSLVECWEKKKKKRPKHNVRKSCVQSQGLIWIATHASLINDQLIHAMDMFTHSGQLIDKQSVSHLLLTNTWTKCCTFPSYKYTNKVFHIFFLQRHTPNNLKRSHVQSWLR